jgi:hypothetical protein
MPTGFPLISTKGVSTVFTFRIPKFTSSALYDPVITTGDIAPLMAANTSDTDTNLEITVNSTQHMPTSTPTNTRIPTTTTTVTTTTTPSVSATYTMTTTSAPAQCAAGQFVMMNANICAACPYGQYKLVPSEGVMHRDTTCTPYDTCPVGFERRHTTADMFGECVACTPGSFKSSVGKGSCQAYSTCTFGKWADPNVILGNTADRNCVDWTNCEGATEYQNDSIEPGPSVDRACKQLTVCNALHGTDPQYERTAKTVTSDRVCDSIAPQCNQGLTYESAAPSVTANRECSNIRVCDQTTHYMTNGPTLTADTECHQLQTCDRETELLVAPTTTTSLAGVDVWTNDAVCNPRPICDPVFQTNPVCVSV